MISAAVKVLVWLAMWNIVSGVSVVPFSMSARPSATVTMPVSGSSTETAIPGISSRGTAEIDRRICGRVVLSAFSTRCRAAASTDADIDADAPRPVAVVSPEPPQAPADAAVRVAAMSAAIWIRVIAMRSARRLHDVGHEGAGAGALGQRLEIAIGVRLQGEGEPAVGYVDHLAVEAGDRAGMTPSGADVLDLVVEQPQPVPRVDERTPLLELLHGLLRLRGRGLHHRPM